MSQVAVFVGYDIPEAMDMKWDTVMSLFDTFFESGIYEGDVIHLLKGESDIKLVSSLLEAFNEYKDIGLTADFFKVNKGDVIIEDVEE